MVKKRQNKVIRVKNSAKHSQKSISQNKSKPKSNSLGAYALVTILVIVFVFILVYSFSNLLKDEDAYKISTCGDGSFYNTCSITKPYMCEKGVLVERARFCGCPGGFSKNVDSCESQLNNGPKEIMIPYLLNENNHEINFKVYKGMYDLLSNESRFISYNGEEKPFRVDFKFKKINEDYQRAYLSDLVVKIQNLDSDKINQARIAISLVQNIEFGESEKRTVIGDNKSLSYSRYPYEVLYDGEGVCGEKSELLVSLLRDLGYGTALFYNKAENHEAVGIACPVEESYWNSGYCFVETSGPSIISDDEINFIGNVKLTSKPEIMFISPGISLPKNLEEYSDADELIKIRQKVEQGKNLNPSERDTLDDLNAKYGLVEIYNA
ncbi:MAG TPA: hypothetical protein VJH92_02730 [Candidatus Nanoarchaeia archaeon]|nr:hypothetical protein [Candidatus Nanoarchaeia archaeon]